LGRSGARSRARIVAERSGSPQIGFGRAIYLRLFDLSAADPLPLAADTFAAPALAAATLVVLLKENFLLVD